MLIGKLLRVKDDVCRQRFPHFTSINGFMNTMLVSFSFASINYQRYVDSVIILSTQMFDGTLVLFNVRHPH